MVFFTCGGCGENFKKPQVEKHIFQCRNFGTLSCMDCNKDFHGDEYKAHTKCITELEKYSEVGFRNAPNHNKGEKKQESWVEIVRATLEGKGPTLNPASRSLLHSLAKHDNVPRKKPKFLNFVGNISRFTDSNTIENVWNLLEQQWQVNKPEPPLRPNQATNGKTTDIEVEKVEKENKKKKRGEEIEAVGDEVEVDPQPQKKKKKRKTGEEIEAVADEVEVDPQPQKKNKKRKTGEEIEAVADEVEVDPEPQKKKKKRKTGEEIEAVADEVEVDPEPQKKENKKRKTGEEIEAVADEVKVDPEPQKKKKKRKTGDEIEAVVDEVEVDPVPQKKENKKRKTGEEIEAVADEVEVDSEPRKKKKKSTQIN